MTQDDHAISTERRLRELYKAPSDTILRATTSYLHPFHIAHIERATFVCIGSVGAAGCDVSPRGGEPGFVKVIGENRIGLPDWPGNNKIETLTNLVGDGRVGLLFLFPGLDYFMRLNGRAEVSEAPGVCAHFAFEGKTPKTVITIAVEQAYFHCGKAINRARLWEPSSRVPRARLPSVGTIMAELAHIDDVSSAALDEAYAKGVSEGLYDPPPDMPGAAH